MNIIVFIWLSSFGLTLISFYVIFSIIMDYNIFMSVSPGNGIPVLMYK